MPICSFHPEAPIFILTNRIINVGSIYRDDRPVCEDILSARILKNDKNLIYFWQFQESPYGNSCWSNSTTFQLRFFYQPLLFLLYVYILSTNYDIFVPYLSIPSVVHRRDDKNFSFKSRGKIAAIGFNFAKIAKR